MRSHSLPRCLALHMVLEVWYHLAGVGMLRLQSGCFALLLDLHKTEDCPAANAAGSHANGPGGQRQSPDVHHVVRLRRPLERRLHALP